MVVVVVVGAAFLAGAAGAGAGAGAGVWAETSDARNVAPSAVTAIKATTRPRIEAEDDIAPGFVGLDTASKEPIEREGLIIAPHQQALDHKTPDLLDRQSPHNEGIESVESAENALDQASALWRIRVGIWHMGKGRGQCRCAMHGNRIAFGGERPVTTG